IGVSADGLFAGVLAWGVALLALGAARPRLDIAAAAVSLTGGLLLGATLFLSYGLVLAGLLPVADTGGTDCCHGTPRRHAVPAGLRRAHQLPVAPAPHTMQRDQQKRRLTTYNRGMSGPQSPGDPSPSCPVRGPSWNEARQRHEIVDLREVALFGERGSVVRSRAWECRCVPLICG
ncbi:MAG: hypothetical protein WBF75_02815, partial [Pseudonocardiaceae bacterium]